MSDEIIIEPLPPQAKYSDVIDQWQREVGDMMKACLLPPCMVTVPGTPFKCGNCKQCQKYLKIK